MTPHEELFALGERLKKAARASESEDVAKPISDLEEAGQEYDPEVVKTRIRELAGEPNLENAHRAADAASDTFKLAKAEIISILQNELDERDDGFLENLKQEVDELKPLSTPDVAQHLSPTGQIMTSDTVVVGPETQIRRI